MIQVQDNSPAAVSDDNPIQGLVGETPSVANENQNPVKVTPVAAAVPSPSPAVSPSPVATPEPNLLDKKEEPVSVEAAPPTQETVAPTTEDNSNEAEINGLLSQLEKLSKEIESKADTSTEVKSEEPKEELKAEPNEVKKERPVEEKAAPKVFKPDVLPEEDLPEKKLEGLVDQKPEEPKEEVPVSEKKDDFDMDKFLTDLEKKIESETPATPAVNEVQKSEETTPEPKEELSKEDSFRKNRIPSLIDTETEEVLSPPEDREPANTEHKAEDLESQNIFDMLNIGEIDQAERSQFLDELEELIWEDFLGADLERMLNKEEYTQAKTILSGEGSEEEKREKLLVFLEKLLPDIEEIMYEKALNLKEEMFMERIRKMEENAGVDLTEVKNLIQADKWKSAVEALNKI